MKLSPKFLGPVEHGQPGLPPAQNVENFHQGSKCFPEEIDPETDDPGPLYYENRLRFYNDAEPHRHKYFGTDDPKNKNIPRFFVWVDKSGTEHRLDYVQSRQFYCEFYARLASAQPDYAELVHKLDAGYNLCLCGFDAIPLEQGETIESAYLDPSNPFGHERVLYTMLTSEQWIWRKYKTFEF